MENNKGKKLNLNEECSEPSKSSSEADQEMLKFAIERLLETDFKDSEQLNVLSSSYAVTVLGCDARFYEVFDRAVRSHAKNILLPELKCVSDDNLLAVLEQTCIKLQNSMEKFKTLFRHTNEPSGLQNEQNFSGCVILSEYLAEKARSLLDTEETYAFVENYRKLVKEKDDIQTLIKKSFKDEKCSIYIDCEFFKLFDDEKIINSLSVFLVEVLKHNFEQASQRRLEENFRLFYDIFNLVQNKELFKSLFHNQLCMRLADSNCSIVKRLINHSGNLYTTSMRRMIEEFDKNALINQHYNWKNNSNFNVKVFSSFDVAFKSTCPINLPPIMARHFNDFVNGFVNFYNSTPGKKRTLRLNGHLGQAEVAFYTAGREDKLLRVNDFQTAVLMLFNARNRRTVTEIAKKTGMPMKILVGALKSLTAGGANVLLKVTAGGEDISPEDAFEVNDNFTSDCKIIAIPMNSNDEEKKRAKKIVTGHKVDCKLAVKAAVVRTMKREKSMKHEDLVAEVRRALEGKFVPEIAEIEGAVENLVAREYIERDEEDKSKYLYVP